MAFTLKITALEKSENLKIDVAAILENCHLKFGSNNEFYVLQEGEQNQNTAILYNPLRIGRGIFFDGSRITDSEIMLSYNIPTTRTEIMDFIRIVKELERQLKGVQMYCIEEEREYTVSQLVESQERMVQFSLESLNNFCRNTEYRSFILTLAMWPFVMSREQVAEFSVCKDLMQFEQTIHDLQNIDAYYANPSLLQNRTDGKILAIYTLTEECDSIFPVSADGFLNLDQINIDKGLIRFFICSEDRVVDGMFDYDAFVEYVIVHGAKRFDEGHILIPSMTKEEIAAMIEQIG